MNTQAAPPDRILSRAEAALMMGLSPRTLDRQTDIPKLKLSASRVGYRLSAVLDWMQSRPSAV